MRARRWLLFGLALASLVVMTYAGVLLAFSVPVTDAMLEANRDVPEASRALVVPIADPHKVGTHQGGEAAFLVEGEGGRVFPASVTDVAMARALAYVSPVNGTYDPPQLSLQDVASRNGTTNLTIDVATLAGGQTGWIVMGSGEDAPRFFAEGSVVGVVSRFASGATLMLAFALGFFGFVAPLVALILTHRPSGRKVAQHELVCRECAAPFPSNGEFCLRCGAYRAGIER